MQTSTSVQNCLPRMLPTFTGRALPRQLCCVSLIRSVPSGRCGTRPSTRSLYVPLYPMAMRRTAPEHRPICSLRGSRAIQSPGNDYFGARYPSSTGGRFMSPDWSAKIEPVPYAKLGSPQSLNLYSDVWNNPLSRSDPNGHCMCADRAKCDSANDKAFQGRLDNLKAAQGTFKEGSKEEHLRHRTTSQIESSSNLKMTRRRTGKSRTCRKRPGMKPHHKNSRWKKAFDDAHEAAKAGSPRSQNFVGYCYDIGKGVRKNPKLALYSIEKAARTGYL